MSGQHTKGKQHGCDRGTGRSHRRAGQGDCSPTRPSRRRAVRRTCRRAFSPLASLRRHGPRRPRRRHSACCGDDGRGGLHERPPTKPRSMASQRTPITTCTRTTRGDVTSVGDGAQTIAVNAVTYAKIQNVAANSRARPRGCNVRRRGRSGARRLAAARARRDGRRGGDRARHKSFNERHHAQCHGRRRRSRRTRSGTPRAISRWPLARTRRRGCPSAPTASC